MPEPVASAVVFGAVLGVAAILSVMVGTGRRAGPPPAGQILIRLALMWGVLALIGVGIWLVAQGRISR